MNSCKLGFSSETPSLTGEEEKFLEGKGDESHMSYLQDELIVCDGSLLHINSSEVHIGPLNDSVLENKGAVSIDVVGGNIDGTAFTSQGQSSAIIAGTIYDQSLSDLIVQDKSGALITTSEEATNTTYRPQGNVDSHVLDSNNSESLPELDSSHTTLEVNVSRAAEAEVRRRGRTVLSGEKSTKDEENVSDNNNGPENIVSEVSEPRRSRRRIQPTLTLLEGLQTSFTSHKRGTNYRPWEILKSLPELNSSHTTLEVNVSTVAEAEVRRKGRTVLSGEKSIDDKENVSDNNNGPENTVSEPRRSRRRIQPTQTLLEGLQTSFTSHKRGTNYRNRGES